MTWLEQHRESERFAADAEMAERRGSREEARRLYSQAAQAEERALDQLDPSKLRTYGISAVSAAESSDQNRSRPSHPAVISRSPSSATPETPSG